MIESLHIGSTPYDEPCVQVADGCDNLPAMRLECKAFIQALRSKIGLEPIGARLVIRTHSHDFGPYADVSCDYDTTKPLAQSYAFDCERFAPATWAEVGMDVRHVADSASSLHIVDVQVHQDTGWEPIAYTRPFADRRLDSPTPHEEALNDDEEPSDA